MKKEHQIIKNIKILLKMVTNPKKEIQFRQVTYNLKFIIPKKKRGQLNISNKSDLNKFRTQFINMIYKGSLVLLYLDFRIVYQIIMVK